MCEPQGAVVVALQRRDGSFITNPPPTTTVQLGDTCFAMGTPEQLDRLKKLASNARGIA